MTVLHCLKLLGLIVVIMGSLLGSAFAHPHVFIEANLEIVRNKKGEAISIRHVWRFDEIFSTSLILDYDDNGNETLDREELDVIAKETSASLSEFNYFTEAQLNSKPLELKKPDPFIIDFKDDQLLMIIALDLVKPVNIKGDKFRVAVSDPTYYVAVEFYDDKAISVSGAGEKKCQSEISRPDFDALYERDKDRLEALYSAGADEVVEGSDDYLTWVNFKCQ